MFSFVLAWEDSFSKNTLGWLMQCAEISGAFVHNKAFLLGHLLSSECLCMFTTPCFACCAACTGGCVCTCHSFTQEIDASSVIRSCSAAWRQFSSPALLLHVSFPILIIIQIFFSFFFQACCVKFWNRVIYSQTRNQLVQFSAAAVAPFWSFFPRFYMKSSSAVR